MKLLLITTTILLTTSCGKNVTSNTTISPENVKATINKTITDINKTIETLPAQSQNDIQEELSIVIESDSSDNIKLNHVKYIEHKAKHLKHKENEKKDSREIE